MDYQSLSAYLPMDRRQALAKKQLLPEHTVGSALFADVSGFTPLTESLVKSLGARLGTEELARYLSMVWDVLIAEVDRYHGSVVDFSGDAITCWFDDEPSAQESAPLALACAFGMQAAMLPFAAVNIPGGETIALAVKTAIASGPARRFLVGDPAIQQIDVIAGQTLLRMADAEEHAQKGEVIVDSATVAQLGDLISIQERRSDAESGEEFTVIETMVAPVEPQPWPILPPDALTEHQIYPWLLLAHRKRLSAGLGEFQPELRPCVSVFLRFGGIDYDADEQAGQKLDRFIQWVQGLLTQYDGLLVDITIGDKGSYLYGGFGAPIAHEDDARRAVDAASALLTFPAELSFIDPLQIGISQGTMRTGAVGGTTRRVYSVLGDEVNLAARLMQHAEPGTILVSGTIHKATSASFAWEPLTPIHVKGKSEPVPIARLLHRLQDAAETADDGAELVGRAEELRELQQAVDPIFRGQFAGLIVVQGEAGMGKSRLVSELRKQPGSDQPVRWLTCPAEPILHQSLYPFRQMLRRYFQQDSAASEPANRERFGTVLASLQADLTALGAPAAESSRDALTRRKSFLAATLHLQQEDAAYNQLEPRLRFENTLLAVKALILAESLRQPVVLFIEDAQWLDDDSQEMIKLLARDSADFALALLLCSRYGDNGERFTINLNSLKPGVPQQTVDLDTLTPAAVKALTSQKLGGPVSDDLVNFLYEETDGNPLFVEQLTLHMQETGVLRQADGVWVAKQHELDDLPIGINAVLVARLDRLTAQVKSVVQMAAVLGHEFEVNVLSQMLKDDALLASKMKQAEAQVIWSAQSEVAYLFRHALLREAAYDMQLEARLREVHGLAGNAIEAIYTDNVAPHAATLAHHFRRAEDRDREYRYARLAGLQAAAHFANAEATTHLSRALELVERGDDQDLTESYELIQQRERVYDRLGQRQAQLTDLETLADLAERLGDNRRRAEAALRRANYAVVTGDYPAALASAQQAVAHAQRDQDAELEAQGQLLWGDVLLKRSDYAAATAHIQQAVGLVQSAALHDLEADSLQALGHLALRQDNFSVAETHFEQALRLNRQLGNRQKEAAVLNALGLVAYERGDNAPAQRLFDEALQLSRNIGDRVEEDVALNWLGTLARESSDLEAARAYDDRALQLSQEIEDPEDADLALLNLGQVALDQGDLALARSYGEQALELSRKLGDRQEESAALCSLGQVAWKRGDMQQAGAYFEQALNICHETQDSRQECVTLNLLGELAFAQGETAQARGYLETALRIAQEVEAHPQEKRARALLDQL